MRYKHIADGDSLFRSCIHPFSFKSKGRRFASSKLIRLSEGGEMGTLISSLAWELYLPTTKHVHAYGCRLSSRMNESLSGGNLKNRRIYCGAYRLSAIAIRALATTDNWNGISSVDVIHNIENGEIAHVDLKISLNLGTPDIEGTKTVIVDRLWNSCNGPLTYIDDCDQDINPHPSSYLSTPPAGPYIDTRSYLNRLWSLIRFRIYSWIWCKFCQNATKS